MPIPPDLINQVDKDILENANQVRIYSLNDYEFPERANKTILRICTAIGISEANLPTLVTKEFVVYALRHKFSKLTLEEVELAFKLNYCGEWEPIQHYQQFNIEFVGQVLSKFIKRKELTLENKAVKPMLPPSVELTTEQRAANHIKLLQDISGDYERWEHDPDREIRMADLKFTELEERGLIRLTKDEKLTWIEKAKKALLETQTKKQVMGEFKTVAESLKQIAIENLSPSMIKTVARELVMKHFFEKWSNEGFNLRKKLLQND